MSKLDIRVATPEDATAAIALWTACRLTRPWNDPEADFRRALAGPSSTILVAREGGVVAGSIMVGEDGHRGWVYYLAVAPDRRRAGLGHALMAAAEAWLQARGAPKIQLMVREGNEEAIAFYRGLGLEVQQVVVLGRFIDQPL
jgi:ribosomal protein S18 acetylase RimI-like enzyme